MTYLGNPSPLTAQGFNALVLLIGTMSTADLLARHPRRVRAERARYRRERASVTAPPAREVQIEIEIIERTLRRRGVAVPDHGAGA